VDAHGKILTNIERMNLHGVLKLEWEGHGICLFVDGEWTNFSIVHFFQGRVVLICYKEVELGLQI
jgi:hypothetical protein